MSDMPRIRQHGFLLMISVAVILGISSQTAVLKNVQGGKHRLSLESTVERGDLSLPPTSVEARKSIINGTGNTIDHEQGEASLFILHVGPHKTGTTTIQNSLDSNPVLENDNYTFIGMRNPPKRRDKFGVRTGLHAFREAKTKEFLDNLSQGLKEARTNLIASSEDFSKMLHSVDNEGNHFFTLLKETLTGRQIHVAVGYRRYHEWLVSLYNQQQRGRDRRQSFVEWYRDSNSFDEFKDSYQTYIGMKKHFHYVSIINVNSPKDLMTDVYCSIIPNATHSCTWAKKKALEAAGGIHANPSVPLWPRTIADEASILGLTSVSREALQKCIVKFACDINYTLPLTCLSHVEEQEILAKTIKYEKAMVPEFYESPLGEKILLEGFEKAVKHKKFCSVNKTHVFQDEQWLSFFSETLEQ